MRLYDLADQYQDILDLLRDEPDSEELQSMLDGLEGAIEEKVENTIKIAKTMEYEVKAIDEEIKRLQERKSSIENGRRRLLENAQRILEGAGLERIRGKFFNVWIQMNPPSVDVIDESIIPKKYFEYKSVIKKKEILDAIKNGEEVPGVEIVQGKGLRIR